MPNVVIKLRLVGASTDLEHLVFSSQKSGRRGSHVAPIDDKMFRVLEDVVRKRRAKQKGEATPPKKVQESKLPPSEVQRLLRSGRSVEQVARSAGTDVAWVQKFLGPVLDERTIAIQASQRARLEKPRLGMSGAPLLESVVRNLRTRRVKITDSELADAWDASRVGSQPWVISVTFSYRGREQRATWRYDPHAREITSVNRLASDLGWVGDARRAPVRASKPTTAKPRTTTTRRATAKRRATTKRRAAAKPRAATTSRPKTKSRAKAKSRAGTKRRATTKRRPAAKPRTAGRRQAAKRRARR